MRLATSHDPVGRAPLARAGELPAAPAWPPARMPGATLLEELVWTRSAWVAQRAPWVARAQRR